jgi:hypothetical protein
VILLLSLDSRTGKVCLWSPFAGSSLICSPAVHLSIWLV